MWIRLPPVHFLLLVLAIVLVGYFATGPRMLDWPVSAWGLAPIVAGIALLAGARALFRRHETNIMTFGKPDYLVTSGPFRFTRNPMYLGFTLMLLGAAMLSGRVVALLAPVVFILLARLWYIPFEERSARAAFGAAYEVYCCNTRRWI